MLEKIKSAALEDFKRRFHSAEWPGQRFGQALVNHFYPTSGEETAAIFYAPSVSFALERLHAAGLVDYD